MLIYKILRRDEWKSLKDKGETTGAPIDVQDGYIHFSTADQVQETANKHFGGEHDLVLLALDAQSLGDALKWEPSRGGQLFPHLYRDLILTEVKWARDITSDGGGHVLPEGVE